MGVGFDADRDAHEHILNGVGFTGDPLKPLNFGHRVQHHVTDTVGDRRGQFRDRFIVAMQGDSLGGKACVQRHSELSPAGNVEGQPLLVDPAGHLSAQECLSGVTDMRTAAEGRRDIAAARPEVILVDDEGRGAELRGDLGHRDPGNRYDTVVAAHSVARPHIRSKPERIGSVQRTVGSRAVVYLVGVPGTGRVRDHIRSGALTPRIPSPLAMTWRVA